MVFWKRQTIIIESIQVFSRTKGKGWELKGKKKKGPVILYGVMEIF